MEDRSSFSAEEQQLIRRVEKSGAELDKTRHGWGFVHAGDKALKLIKKIPGIQFLDLFEACDEGEVSDEGLANIKGMIELRYLALGPGITDAGLSNLAGLTELRELRLDSARDVTDAGLAHLRNLTGLRELSLQYTDITSPGLQQLTGFKKLKSLNLQGTAVTGEAVQSLQAALPKCEILRDPAKPAAKKRKSPKKEAVAPTAGGGVHLKLRTTLRGHADKVGHATFSADSACLGSVASHKVIFWDGSSGAKLRMVGIKGGALWGAAFTPDGKLFAAGSNHSCVIVWETATGNEKLRLEADTPVITALDIDRSGKFVAAGGDDGRLYLWQLPSGKLQTAFAATSGDFFGAVAFSPDGTMLASCGRDSFVSLWDVPSGKKQLELHGPPHPNEYAMIRSVAFHPDGTTLASTHWDNTICLWGLPQGNELRAIQLPQPVAALAWSPDGRLLATASNGDTLLRLWDPLAGMCLAEFETGADWNAVNVVAFSPNGKSLVANGKGGSLLLLDVHAP